MATRGSTINRPHWKEKCEQAEARIVELEAEVERLRANGADSNDLAKIKAEAFAAGVASAVGFVRG